LFTLNDILLTNYLRLLIGCSLTNTLVIWLVSWCLSVCLFAVFCLRVE